MMFTVIAGFEVIERIPNADAMTLSAIVTEVVETEVTHTFGDWPLNEPTGVTVTFGTTLYGVGNVHVNVPEPDVVVATDWTVGTEGLFLM